MIAHLLIRNGQWAWSGYGASGDPDHRPYGLVVDIGRDFIITDEGKLYLIGPGPLRFTELSPEAVVMASRRGWFDFRVREDDEAASRQRDRGERARRKLGRRGRIAAEQREG